MLSTCGISTMLRGITSNTTAIELWQYKSSFTSKLNELSKQSILTAPDERIEYQKQFFELIYQAPFDALFGGIILPLSDHNPTDVETFIKPIAVNILMAGLLLDADQVFYTGDLNDVGVRIIDHLCKLITKTPSGLLEKELLFERPQLDCFFTSEQIHQNLTDKEQSLFIALVGKQSKKSTEQNSLETGHLFCLSQNLNSAASEINMPIKQAQILEYSIQSKLKQISTSLSHCERKLNDSLSTNCQLLILLSNSYHYTSERKLIVPATKLANSILETIAHNQMDQQTKVSIIFATLHFLQIDFKLNILDKLCRVLDLLSPNEFDQELTPKHLFERQAISEIIEGLVDASLIDVRYAQLTKTLKTSTTKQWQLILLSQRQIDLDRQMVAIRAKFNPYQLVFKV